MRSIADEAAVPKAPLRKELDAKRPERSKAGGRAREGCAADSSSQRGEPSETVSILIVLYIAPASHFGAEAAAPSGRSRRAKCRKLQRAIDDCDCACFLDRGGP